MLDYGDVVDDVGKISVDDLKSILIFDEDNRKNIRLIFVDDDGVEHIGLLRGIYIGDDNVDLMNVPIKAMVEKSLW